MKTNISEFERTKPTKTFRLLESLISDYDNDGLLQIDSVEFKSVISRLKEIRESFLSGE
jgi:hypothetical protein